MSLGSDSKSNQNCAVSSHPDVSLQRQKTYSQKIQGSNK